MRHHVSQQKWTFDVFNGCLKLFATCIIMYIIFIKVLLLCPAVMYLVIAGVNCTLLSDIRRILRSSATARECWSDWSRCLHRTSFFTGILWRNSPNQCRHLGFSGGRCLPSPSINCPCILPGNEQCHCF